MFGFKNILPGEVKIRTSFPKTENVYKLLFNFETIKVNRLC